MKQDYDVSIIVPTYNYGRYIEKCMDSLFSQATDLAYEVIVVDDGSTDGTEGICEKYKGNKNFSYFHKKNTGVSDSRNYGIRVSKGEYVLFVDADDYVLPNYVDCIAGKAVWGGFDLVAAGYTILFERDQKKITNAFQEDAEFKDLDGIRKGTLAFGADGLLNVSVCKCFRKRKIMENCLAYDTGLTTGEDLVFNAAFLASVESLAIVKATPYCYVRRDIASGVNSYKENLYSMVCRCLGAVNQLYGAYGLLAGEGQTLIGNFYLDYISAGIYNLYRKECPLSFQEKSERIRELFALDHEKKYACSDRSDPLSRLMAGMLRRKNAVVANLIYSFLFGCRNHMEPAYLWLRGKVIHKVDAQDE